MRKTLTARFVETVKADTGRAEYVDTVTPGLALRVGPRAKAWVALYKTKAGQVRRQKLGTFPTLGLAEARQQALAAMRAVHQGADPAAKAKAEAQDTFGNLAELYIERHAKRTKRTWQEDERILARDLLPAWRHVPARSLTRRQVRELLDGIADRAPVMANRTLALVSKVLNFGVDREWLDANPAARLQKPTREVSRERVLTDDEVAHLWTALDAAEAHYGALAARGRVTLARTKGAPLLRPALADWLRLRLLTAQRGGEVLAMQWADLDFEARTWTIPATVAKNKCAHVVPLAGPVIEILAYRFAEAREAGTETLPWVFLNDLCTGPMFDRAKKVRLDALLPASTDVRGHDLRRTAASGMGRLGIPGETIARVLNHVDRGPRATSVYDRFDRMPEKRAALDRWAREVERIVTGAALPKVVAIGR
jgi:integrase